MDKVKKYEPLWGAWYVDSVLGTGSLGKVYKIHKEEFGRIYEAALKMISIPQSESDIQQMIKTNGIIDENSIRTYFNNYIANIVKQIDLMRNFAGNPNIVSIEDYEVMPGNDLLGYDLLGSDILIREELLTSLSTYTEHKSMTESDVMKLGIDISNALELLSAKKIIHRNIKPENIFISFFGDFKLGDFGFDNSNIEKTTEKIFEKEARAYMAPEVYNAEKYGVAADIYSLGLVMYRCLNENRLPFTPENVSTFFNLEDAIIKRLIGEKIPDIPNINHALNACILKACAFNPEDRFENATKFRLELEKIAEMLTESYVPDINENTNNQGFLGSKVLEYDNVINEKVEAKTEALVANIDTSFKEASTNKNLDLDITSQFTKKIDETYDNVKTSQNSNKNSEKSNPDKTAILVIVGIILFVFLGYFINTELLKKNNSITSTPQEETEFERLLKAAERGDADAQLFLAIVYNNGYFYEKVIKRDVKKAIEWLTKSAEQGLATAQYYLGVMYEHSYDITRDLKMAVEWYIKASENGYSEANRALGDSYYDNKDYKEAFERYMITAENGYIDAQYRLGVMYKNGYYVKKDDKKAFEWYTIATQNGHATAQNNLAYMYEHGHYVKQNYKKAVELYTQAAEQGDKYAQYNLGRMYYYGKVEKDETKAINWWKKAAAQGHEDAKAALVKLGIN